MCVRNDMLKGLFEDVQNLPLSFVYGGRPSREFLRGCDRIEESRTKENGAVVRTITYQDGQSGIVVKVEAVTYKDFPAIEWVIRFENTGDAPTDIIENVQALDCLFNKDEGHNPILSYLRGSFGSRHDFAPMESCLWAGKTVRLSSVDGRSSSGEGASREDGAMPVFDVWLKQQTLICAIGWTGQWQAEIESRKDSIRIQAGMEGCHLRLLPGESIRTPRIVLFCEDDKPEKSRNSYRRFILEHHAPEMNGQPVQGPVAACGWVDYRCGNDVTEANQIEFIDSYVKAGLKLDAFWLDAGWYDGMGDWARDVGNWTPKKEAFPNGLRPVAEFAKENGMGFVLWFEPERVCPGTWLYEQHPEWLLKPTSKFRQNREKTFYSDYVESLLDLGNPEARQWLIEHISHMIAECGITVYRQDFNVDPLEHWKGADAPDRQGITQIRYIEGLYDFWDELRRRHPGLVIDNCASGGRRLDIEMCSRSIPLWRTDYFFEPEGLQCQMLGISRYYPVHATGFRQADAYHARSALGSGIVIMSSPLHPDFDVEGTKKRLEEYHALKPLFIGDFYALTAHSTNSDVWCAYQFDRPDLRKGAVMLFRRKASPHAVGQFCLQGLDPEKKYDLTWNDRGDSEIRTGQQLMSDGVSVELPAPGSEIIFYRVKE